MKNLTIALAAALSLTTIGCKKKGDMVAKMDGFQKSMCACTDKACAEKVNLEMTEWGMEMAKKDKPDADTIKKVGELRMQYSECMTKLTMAGGTTVPAPEPAAAAPAATCSATAWKEPGGAFCVEATGYKAGDVAKGEGDDPEMKVRFTRTDKPEIGFAVSWYPKRDAATTAVTMASNMDSDFKNNKGLDRGQFFGGKGRFVVFARADNEKSQTMYAIVQGTKAAYQCEASSFDAPIAPESVAACKSVIPTDGP